MSLLAVLKRVKRRLHRLITGRFKSGWIDKLDRIERSARFSTCPRPHSSLKVLFGPSFAIYPPSFVLDRLMSCALRMKGVEVHATYCDAVQDTECNYFGGVWGGGENFRKNCQFCVSRSVSLWKNHMSFVHPLSTFITSKLRDRIHCVVEKLADDDWHRYQEDDLPIGAWARDILINNYVVGDHRLVDDHEHLGRTHLANLMIVKESYDALLSYVEPNRVVSNDSYYGMWAILQELCKRRNIPFYSHYHALQNRTAVAYNNAAMNLDFRRAWERFSSIELTDVQRRRLNQWIAGKRRLLINTAELLGHEDVEVDMAAFDPAKPTALLAANVVWDLAALNKQFVFNDMMEWICETVRWFSSRPQLQLIVKAHPAETNPSVPATQETVEETLRSKNLIHFPNIFFVSGRAKVTVKQLFPLSQLGLVHTSTVGLEMVVNSIPVITTARAPYRGFGFTADPENRKTYFETIESLLARKSNALTKHQINLAEKFLFFYQFHYYSNLGLCDFKWGQTPSIRIRNAKGLLSGENPAFDHMLDSIQEGLAIVAEDRWPPET